MFWLFSPSQTKGFGLSAVKVIVLSTSFPLDPGSPSGIFVARLLHHLSGEVEITVLTPGDSTARQTLTHANITVVPFRYAPLRLQTLTHRPGGIPVALQRNKLAYLLLPLLLSSMLMATIRHCRHSNVIHANWAICGVIAGIASRLTRVPAITTLRGADVNRANSSRTDRYLLRCCLAWNRQVVAVSEAIAAGLRRDFPRQTHKIVFIPNGVDGRLTDVQRAPYGSERPVRLLTVGSLIPRKGIDQIIQALNSLSDEPVTLEIVGTGPEQRSLQTLARRLSVNDRITFAGQVEPEQIIEVLLNADIFVLASHSEGRPNVVLEAMATGLPVVATDIEGTRELVQHQHSGLLFTDGNQEELVDSLRRLTRDPDLRSRLGSAARRTTIERGLVWPVTAERYHGVYRAVAGLDRACAESWGTSLLVIVCRISAPCVRPCTLCTIADQMTAVLSRSAKRVSVIPGCR